MAVLSNDIYIGSVSDPLYHYTNVNFDFESAKGVFALDLIGNELSIDTFSFTVHYVVPVTLYKLTDSRLYKLMGNQLYALKASYTQPKDYLKELPYGTPVWWYVGGTFYAKGYLKSVDRISKTGYKLTCVSGVGLLESVMHTGGLYQGVAISTVLSSIIGSAFSYTVSNAVQSTLIYGRLPYDTKRNNLHRLLFATGAALKKGTASNDYVIDYLSDTVTEVPASRVALQGSVQYQLPSNKVEVTEHSFFYDANVATETLFDNTSGVAADHLIVVFQEPVYVSSLATTGTLTVNSSGENYAVVTGTGTLTGKYYTHTTQVLELSNNPNNDPERVRRVEDNELVTATNSRNVAKRVLSYFQSAKTVKAKLLTQGEKCGDCLQFTDAFGDITAAYLSRMDTLVTSVIGAQCQLIEGYIPTSGGNNFTHRVAFTTGTTFTVPAGVDFMRFVLIGGGTGGQGGYDGTDGAGGDDLADAWPTVVDYPSYNEWTGKMSYYSSQPAAGVGGNGGSAGSAGKVYVFEHEVTPGETINVAIGSGGIGGARNGGSGVSGFASQIYSSSTGTISSSSGVVGSGYYDPFTGDAYALPGVAGVKGGDGGQTDVDSLAAWHGYSGISGTACGNYAGGAGGAGVRKTHNNNYGLEYSASGGGGGGAAYGANGGAGGAGEYTPRHWNDQGTAIIPDDTSGGKGGNGANAVAPSKPTYGCAGNGGNGGGGGGNGGGCFTVYPSGGSFHSGAKGTGGNGSAGGAGGDGIVIIYY